jgi:hypothetical protein
MTVERADRLLRYAAILLGFGVIVHGADHTFFQDRGLDGLTSDVMTGGTIVFIASFIVIGLVFTGSSRAPQAAAAVGFFVAVGVSLVHIFLAQGPPIVDSYPALDMGAGSWAAMLTEVASAILFGLAGLNAMHARSRTAATA